MSNNNYILLKTTKGSFLKIEIAEILYCEAKAKETIIFTKSKETIWLSLLLKHVEHMLLGYNFVRISRKHLVNFDKCTLIKTKPKALIILSSNIKLRISRRNVKYMLNKLG